MIFVFSGHQSASQNESGHKTLLVKLSHQGQQINLENATSVDFIPSIDRLAELEDAEKLIPSVKLPEQYEYTSEVKVEKTPQVVTQTIEDYYYKSSELASQPYPLNLSTPEYPPRAIANNTEGWV
ncbi:MAG: phage baseplate upper protein, partial [Acetobacteraceae bacterium]|nr:phage baseplate upper protein [Acetobacteraceae bacterium]